MVEINYKKNNVHKNTLVKLAMSLMLSSFLNGCSAYSGKFLCGDSLGAPCVMLSEIDKQINSGEIVEVYKDRKCNGSKCYKDRNISTKAKLKDNKTHRALIIENKDEIDYREGDYLYVK